jgi:YegS/Rv2252/BmrU family lipid kinase
MRKAALLFNQNSGGGRIDRGPELQAGLQLLRDAGIEASLTVTTSSDDAAERARSAILAGADTILACGGDGTIHDVLQGVAGTGAALGVVPLGTANALAHDLGLPLRPLAAIRAALHADHKRVALGAVEFTNLAGRRDTRFFTVAVGIGVDAHLFYKLHSGAKQRLGMAAYYAKAWQLWFSHQMQKFAVECNAAGSAETRSALATEMLAVRIRNFGGVLRELAPGASLERDDLRVVLCETSSRLAYLAYVTRGLFGVNWRVRGVNLVHAHRVSCGYVAGATNGHPESGERVYVEADGELIGTLPVEIKMVPDALTLLVPGQRRR